MMGKVQKYMISQNGLTLDNSGGILFHGDLLSGALKSVEVLHIEERAHFETCPLRILWVDLVTTKKNMLLSYFVDTAFFVSNTGLVRLKASL